MDDYEVGSETCDSRHDASHETNLLSDEKRLSLSIDYAKFHREEFYLFLSRVL